MHKKLIRNKIKNAFKESLGFPPILPLPKEACREEEKLKGGLADGKTLKDLAKDHKVSLSDIVSQVEKGKDIEAEHTDNPDEQKEIAKDHVSERPDYYDALDAAGIDESIINEMPYFDNLPDKDGKILDLQMEKWATEEEFKKFLIDLFSGEYYSDEKQPLYQVTSAETFIKGLTDFNQDPTNPATQLLVQFTKKFKSNGRKVNLKTITPEDIKYLKSFVVDAYNKSKEKFV
jgi:hypothetical protein